MGPTTRRRCGPAAAAQQGPASSESHRPTGNLKQFGLITLHHNYNPTTLQLQLQLRYTTLHPAVVGEVTNQVTTATIAATSKNTTPTTFRSISGFTLPFVIRNNQALLISPIGFLC